MTKTVTLAQGILRGENRITDITVRKPLTKQLRGVSISHLIEMNADDWQIVLPRVTTPKVDKVDFAQMTVTDFTKLCSTAAELMFEDAEEIDADEDSTGKQD
ncbi:MAG: phage tail assembly protein [Haemophilus parahaemolyticus]|uniref:phage tail assembly protein n=1 Tax=Haemophilus parahaemolyticus TaxID=735 RepID=UPI0026ED0D1E|nr:phage tail assembly protein [Haemophilus parahaemolyticus]MBS6009450.1 phage tail assembly protein [Haemophilus parahaemolyticus]